MLSWYFIASTFNFLHYLITLILSAYKNTVFRGKETEASLDVKCYFNLNKKGSSKFIALIRYRTKIKVDCKVVLYTVY